MVLFVGTDFMNQRQASSHGTIPLQIGDVLIEPNLMTEVHLPDVTEQEKLKI